MSRSTMVAVNIEARREGQRSYPLFALVGSAAAKQLLVALESVTFRSLIITSLPLSSSNCVMDYERYPQHDEISLVRLVRRLESSVANPDERKPTLVLQEEEVWLKVQRSLQKAKFARRLVRNIEANDFEPSSSRVTKRHQH
ncbi:hypothetical protein GALMADRAFT_1272467 [Galerina marginata CBS 339.88]|uniref:Uncharacterized protein n=1 Tax=Galerina marginata (strain CBS 339.88) TaxID=685588 RepID=A0A067T6Q9_GALM3|nr:hypothetical protein GALMADRAFT_1272467 [Galerina marginata CBS 339.88]